MYRWMREKICSCSLLLSFSCLHHHAYIKLSCSAWIFSSTFQLANEMDTRGISSSRVQYNWGAYYKWRRIKTLKCVQKATASAGKLFFHSSLVIVISSELLHFGLSSIGYCCVIMKYFVNINRIWLKARGSLWLWRICLRWKAWYAMIRAANEQQTTF